MTLKKLVHAEWFNNLIIGVIFVNAILIGVQTSMDNSIVDLVQKILLIVFIVEIPMRWFGRNSTKEYAQNGWNWFDIIIVSLALVPESMLPNAAAMSAFRVLRVFRVLRLFKAFPELQLMVKVLIRSVQSVSYAGLLLLVFMYIYSIIGVILFKGDCTVVTAHTDFIDPFGTIGEAFFSLFRVTTGEDWTDLRYDLMTGTAKTPSMIMNIYYISWYILSAFLLINIVFGAVINNYEKIQEEATGEESSEHIMMKKIDALEKRLESLTTAMEQHPQLNIEQHVEIKDGKVSESEPNTAS